MLPSPLSGEDLEEGSNLALRWNCFLCSFSLPQNHLLEEESSSKPPPPDQNPQQPRIRVLLKYLLCRCEENDWKESLLNSSFHLEETMCTSCERKACEIERLHLQLEVTQMKLIDKLKQLKKILISTNSPSYPMNPSGGGGKKTNNINGETRKVELLSRFHSFIRKNDACQVDVPLIYLEKFTGSSFSREFSSSSKLPQKDEVELDISEGDNGTKTEVNLDHEDKSGSGPGGPSWLWLPVEEELEESPIDGSVKDEEEDPLRESDDDFNPAQMEDDISSSPSAVSISSNNSKKQPKTRTIRNSKEASCDICGALLKSGSLLRDHLKTHHSNETRFECELCEEVFINFENFLVHYRRHRRREKKLRCAMCPEEETGAAPLKLFDELPRHLDEVHGMSQLRLQCDFPACSKVFYHSRYLKRHRLTSHLNVQCDLCELSFSFKSSLKQHKISKHGFPKLKCGQCPPPGKFFVSSSSLSSHRAVHHSKKTETFKCSQCSKEFLSSTLLKNHLLRHVQTKDFACDKCSFRTNTRHSLLRHFYRAHPLSNVVCEVCGFSTKNKDYLQQHLTRHHSGKPVKATKEKLFECHLCEEKLRSRVRLTEHLTRAHGETRAYSCRLCGTSYNHQPNLMRHNREKHPELKKRFSWKELQALAGKGKATGEGEATPCGSGQQQKIFECHLCGVCYKHSNNLAVHKRRKHPKT